MKLTLTLILIFISSLAMASQKAITDAGDIVILNDNGTWTLESNNNKPISKIETNNAVFKKGKDATFAVKSKNTNSMFWISPQKWSFERSGDTSEREYGFQLKGEDLYGMNISEGIEIDLDNLTKIAFENAKEASVDVRITKKEYRVVNGNKVIYMEMEGTMKGISFTYFGYYFSNSSGSTQFLAYTGTNLKYKYKDEINAFLNGFDTQ